MAEKMIVSLVPVFFAPKSKRAKRAIKRIRSCLAKRFHVEEKAVFISAGINRAVFEKGFQKIPRRLEIMVESEKDRVLAFLKGEKLPEKKEAKKEKAEKKPKEESKEEREEREELERRKREKHEKELAAEKTAIKMKTDRV
ncbi:MAG: hypothetical protein QXK06_03625 [Candidatus Diapherotrites archaeon]